MAADKEHRDAIERAARSIESRSGAEIVVAVRDASATYREGDYLFGMVGVVLMLGVLLYAPEPFALQWWVPDVVAAFALFSFVSAYLPSLKRWTVSARSREDAVDRTARAAFHDLDISRTRERTGILVFVSLLERRVVVVPDIGVVDAEPDWDREIAELSREAVDLDRFAAALKALGKPLARALPRSADDRDELAEEWA